MGNSFWYKANIKSRELASIVIIAVIGVSGTFVLPAQSADLVLGSSNSREFAPSAPKRILDTRSGLGGVGPLGAGQVLTVQIGGTSGVPITGAGAVVLNITATQPTESSFLTIYPTGETRPGASNLNIVAGQTVPNMVIAKLGAKGQINVFNAAGSVQVLADVMGWFPLNSAFQSQTPVRILDTRIGLGAPAVPVGPSSEIEIQITGRGGLPVSGVAAVVLNVTATQPTASSWVAVYPSQSPLPPSSNLNFSAGQTIPNLVIAAVGPNGRIVLHNNSGNVHLLADVQGWFPTSSSYHPLVPDRVLDTRSAIGVAATSPIGPNSTVNFKVTGRNGIPATGVGSVVMNVTAIAPSSDGWAAAFATGSNLPDTSNLNFVAGDTIPNLVVAQVGVDGRVSLLNRFGTTHFVVDVAGWFPSIPPNILDAGQDFTCFVRSGSVLCAGDNRQGQLGSPPSGAPLTDLRSGNTLRIVPGITNAVSVSTGDFHACALLVDQTVKCWGWLISNSSGSTNSPMLMAVTGVSQVATASATTCALKFDGSVWCWGSGLNGEFGSGSQPSSNGPVQVSGITGATELSGSGAQFCVKHSSGVSCWGGYRYPIPTTTTFPPMRPVTAIPELGADVVSISTGSYDFGCATLTSGRIKCWGFGYLGNGTSSRSDVPVEVSGITNAVSVSAGVTHTCATLASGNVSCWGWGRLGALGAGSSSQTSLTSTTPIIVPGIADAKFTAVGAAHTCALFADLSVRCWGSNNYGQLANGYMGSSTSPTLVPRLSGATQLVLGPSSSCGLISEAATCWGTFIPGIGGSNDVLNLSSEPRNSTLTGVSRIATGQSVTCGISSGAVACVGSNRFSTLGTTSGADATSPVQPLGLSSGVTDIAVAHHACAVKSGELWCWGSSPLGPTGPVSVATPAQVPGISNAVTVKVTGANTCFLQTDGTVSCFGDGSSNLLGTTSPTASSSTPVSVAGLSGAVSLSLGSVGCVTTTAGLVKCWGNQNGLITPLSTAPGQVVTIPGIFTATKVAVGATQLCAQLADGTVACAGGTLDGQPQPLQVTVVPGLVSVVDIEASGDRWCAKTSNGNVYCWGTNEGGGLGNGTGFYLTPQIAQDI